jgi:lipocalin
VTLSHPGPLADIPFRYSMDAWFEDPGTNRRWRERMLGVFINRSEIRVVGDDHMIVRAETGKGLWLLSRTPEPSSHATAALAVESAEADIPSDEIHWPYRAD